MLPDEMQTVIAKILFIIFATFTICFTKAKATPVSSYHAPVVSLLDISSK